jgi:hypothetical protein
MKKLSRMTDDELLGLRFRDLDIAIKGTWLERCITRLYSELDARGIRFHPPCFLADEWLCPDGEPIIGIAWYLAHPRLKRLETKMVLEAEGDTVTDCMKLLRHECGHALNYAYELHRRRRWRELFGSFSEAYPDRYKYRPYSKRFVRHLDEWYAQYHPDEDFAETFAVWLNPKSGWRRKYKGWPALKKLQYVDELMGRIGVKQPKHPDGTRHWDVSRLRSTLRTHYRKKTRFYAENYPDFHDLALRNIFLVEPNEDSRKAVEIMRELRRPLRNQVSRFTGEKKYIVDSVLRDISKRCRELKLYAPPDGSQMAVDITAYVTSLVMNYLYTGRFKRETRAG